MPDPKLNTADELIGVWHLRWVSRRNHEAWQRAGSVTMPADRLNKLIQDAQAEGFRIGEQQGRYNLRRDIESGEIEPIGRVHE